MNKRQILGLALMMSPLVIVSVAVWLFAPEVRLLVVAIWGAIVSLLVVIMGGLLLFLGGDYE